ncbi:unnamed protein product, partial [Musa acuminata subsp. burmannicoides]
ECNTRTSQGVTHPSTTLAQARLTSECDHTSTKAPDPIRTPKLSVLGRE